MLNQPEMQNKLDTLVFGYSFWLNGSLKCGSFSKINIFNKETLLRLGREKMTASDNDCIGPRCFLANDLENFDLMQYLETLACEKF